LLGDELDPDTITQALGVPSTYARRQGEVLPGADPRTKPAKEGVWSFSVNFEHDSVDDELAQMIARLNRVNIPALPNVVDAYVDVFVASEGKGDETSFELSSETIRLLAQCEVPLRVTVVLIQG
jgi:hypothetical protein